MTLFRSLNCGRSATNKVVSRSNVRPTDEPTSPNLRIDPLTATEVVTFRHLPSARLENDEKKILLLSKMKLPMLLLFSPKHAMPILEPHDLVGGLFLFHKKMVSVYELE